MTSTRQRAELQRQIWQIANDVRGSVDGWDFKQYVLGTLFYRFISENFALYIEGGDESINYAELPDHIITFDIKDDAIKTKGYFIYPSQLFANVAANATTNANLNTDLAAIFAAIESSANGYPSEVDIKGLFADFDTTSNRLGNTVKDKNSRLAAVLKGVEKLTFGNFQDNQIDLFGDAYEFLISNYAANAGKSGGEFFTPQNKGNPEIHGGFATMGFCCDAELEARIAKEHKVTVRCIPIATQDEVVPCVFTGKPGKRVLFAKSY